MSEFPAAPPSAVDRAWARLAAEIEDDYQGSSVTHDWLGFRAVFHGRERRSPSMTGIRAQLDQVLISLRGSAPAVCPRCVREYGR